jgi:hypothetical protein
MATDELRDLQERVALVDELSQSQGWDMLWDRALVTVRAKQLRLVQGKAGSYEDYLRETSFLEGMDFVRKLPERLRLELERVLDDLPPEDEEDEEAFS